MDVSGKLSANSHYSITELLFLYTAISIRTTATGIVYCKGYIHSKVKKKHSGHFSFQSYIYITLYSSLYISQT